MTVRVTTISGGAGVGVSVGRYYDQLVERQKDAAVERALEAGAVVSAAVGVYYESASGAFWMGAGAEQLGLEGVPGKWDIARLVDGVDAAGNVLGRKFGDTSARAFDVTFSVQKEVSILWAAAGPEVREIIEHAMVDAATAVLADQVGARATTRMRTGPDGEFLAADRRPVMVPAEGPAVAIIPEFTSRKGDPQLHVHGLVSSKVWEPTTGRWLAIDARELKHDQRALSGMFHGGFQAELSRRLGVDWGESAYRYARTINGISDSLVDVFSQRRADVDQRLAEKLSRFEDTFGRAPTPQQRWRLEREAAVDSRPAKDAEHLDFANWQHTIAAHTGLAPEDFIARVIGNTDLVSSIDRATFNAMITATIGELSDTKSSWTRGDFKAELTRVLPANLAVTPKQLVELINTYTDHVLDQLIEVTPETVDRPLRRWTTSDVLGEELDVLTSVMAASTDIVDPNPMTSEHAPDWLDPLQLHAAARVASNSDFELVVGLAGVGKTTMLKTAVDTIYADHREAFGLAPSATAAEVLGQEANMATENISKFLWEHTQRDTGPSPEYQLPAGSVLIVDEAGMVSTPHWQQLTALAIDHDWQLRAVGDPYQFAAIGRGGIYEHLLNTLPDHRISRLEQVHRFTNPLEAAASAQLRAGDPDSLDFYFNHDRVHLTATPRALIDAVTERYMTETRNNTDVGVFAPTNTLVGDLNTAIQKQRLKSGELGDGAWHPTAADGRRQLKTPGLYIGDIIETRTNHRNLETSVGGFVKNRDRWTVTASGPDNSLEVTSLGGNGTVTLPADYIANHVQLAYAQTSHASQGRTVAIALTVLDPEQSLVDRAGLYVPLTRGRHSNEVYIHTPDTASARNLLEDAISRRWNDTPAITHTTPDQPHDLAAQLDHGHELLEQHTTEQLEFSFDTPPPAPTQTNTGQVQTDPDPTPTPPPPAPVAQTDAQVLPVDVLARHIATVNDLAWGVKNAHTELDHIRTQHTATLADYRQTAAAHNKLVETRNTHADKPPLIRGVKKWETQLDRYDRQLASSSQRLEHLKTNLDSLKASHSHWSQYRSLPTQLRYNTARQELATDRTARGQQQLDNPTITERLGPTPTEPNARAAWIGAAGAITQHEHLTNSLELPQTPEQRFAQQDLTRHTRTAIKTAVNELAQHIGHHNIPELTPTRSIEPPGRGLSL